MLLPRYGWCRLGVRVSPTERKVDCFLELDDEDELDDVDAAEVLIGDKVRDEVYDETWRGYWLWLSVNLVSYLTCSAVFPLVSLR